MPACATTASAASRCMYGCATVYRSASTKTPMKTESINDWLNTRFARSCCCAPTACDTMAAVPAFRICVSASTRNQRLPAAAKPAATSLPSIDTNFMSVTKYATCTAMAMNIWIDIDATCPGIDPTLRFFMWSPNGGGLNDRPELNRQLPKANPKEKAGREDRPFASCQRGSPVLFSSRSFQSPWFQSPQGNVVMTPMRPRASLVPTPFSILNGPLASVPVILPKMVKWPAVQLSCTA